MTKAEFIKEMIKRFLGAPLDEVSFGRDEFTFTGCDGIKCPKEVRAGHCREECPYCDFWEQEVEK